MAHFWSTTGELSQRGPKSESWSLLSLSGWILYQLLSKTWPIGGGSCTSIHILDNDSLLNIFHFCRLAPSFSASGLSGGNEADVFKIFGAGNWNHERWWYSLARVCRRWRYLVLESASLLDLSLHCTYGTPVVDIVSAHLPPLPLILDYCDIYDYINADDELGIIFALWHRDRVRCIRISQPFPVLERLIEELHGEFPILEYLFIEIHPHCGPSVEYSEMDSVEFPKTFWAPRLRYLVVMGFQIPIGSPLFTTTGSPVTLSLIFSWIDYFHPSVLLRQLSVMRQQETQGNTFNTSGQSLQRAIMRRITPYLRHFGLVQGNAHLETHLPQVTIRLLERLQLCFFNQLTYLMPRRPQFMSTVVFPSHPWFDTVMLVFLEDHSRVYALRTPDFTDRTLSMRIGGRHFNWQVAHTAQVCHMLKTAFSTVKHLSFRHDRGFISPEWNNEADRTQWRKLLRTFGNAETLYVEYEFIGQLSRSLQPGEGESPMDMLPELHTLRHSAVEPSNNAFAQFIDARQKAGHPIIVTQH